MIKEQNELEKRIQDLENIIQQKNISSEDRQILLKKVERLKRELGTL